jgi:hypothetical protein
LQVRVLPGEPALSQARGWGITRTTGFFLFPAM